MRVTRHAYVVEGWGVGELWEAGGRVVVAHDAPRERPRGARAPVAAVNGWADPARPGAEDAATDGAPASAQARLERTRLGTHSPERSRVAASVLATTPRGTPGVPTETLAAAAARPGHGFVPELLQRIHRFHRGEPVAFDDVPLDLDWCTPFQRDVAETLRRVPWGEVVSYGELAAAAGYPRAHRAVGTFCAENRFSLFLPCHRVVAAGGIGSYGPSGVSRKRRLLRLEGHVAL
jgi:O-6-methylguanine DNA methyltransferase